MMTTIGSILNVIILVFGMLTCLISLFILISIIYHCCYNRVKQEDRITIIHCINIYLFIFLYITVIFSLNIETRLGDLYGKNFNSSFCKFMGFITGLMISLLYWSFINQVSYS